MWCTLCLPCAEPCAESICVPRSGVRQGRRQRSIYVPRRQLRALGGWSSVAPLLQAKLSEGRIEGFLVCRKKGCKAQSMNCFQPFVCAQCESAHGFHLSLIPIILALCVWHSIKVRARLVYIVHSPSFAACVTARASALLLCPSGRFSGLWGKIMRCYEGRIEGFLV